MGLASWWLLMLLGQGAVSSTVPLEPRVTFGIRNYLADGRFGGSATVSADETGYVWVNDNFCTRGAGSVQSFSLSDPKAFAWRLTARTVDRTPDAWIVDVEWQRVWDRGQPTPLSQKSSRRLTLRVGRSRRARQPDAAALPLSAPARRGWKPRSRWRRCRGREAAVRLRAEDEAAP